jgi:hypothetical protein
VGVAGLRISNAGDRGLRNDLLQLQFDQSLDSLSSTLTQQLGPQGRAVGVSMLVSPEVCHPSTPQERSVSGGASSNMQQLGPQGRAVRVSARLNLPNGPHAQSRGRLSEDDKHVARGDKSDSCPTRSGSRLAYGVDDGEGTWRMPPAGA